MTMASSSSLPQASLRPVTYRWPSSSKIWQDTSLPLACVVIPFSSSPTSPTTLHTLASIPKCLSCGAPQQDETHLAVHGGTANLCHLCYKVTSRLFSDQVAARPSETLDESTYRRRGYSNKNDSTHQQYALPLVQDIYKLPTMSCPPIWWIVIDGTTPTSPNYWNTVASSLSQVLICNDAEQSSSIPPYLHVGLLVSSSADTIGVWDLTSAVPHVKHYQLFSGHQIPTLSVSSLHSNLQAALRALGDSSSANVTRRRNTNNKSDGMPLGATLELILHTMNNHVHPGNSTTSNNDDETYKCPTYAGGRILCILGGGQAPLEVQTKRRQSTAGNIGTGGVGGTCAVIGQRYSNNNGNHNTTSTFGGGGDVELGGATSEAAAGKNVPLHTNDETDLTAANLSQHYSQNSKMPVEQYYSELGQECARAGFGVDVLVLDLQQQSQADVGIPFLRQLSDRSGTPGPLIVTTPQEFQRQLTAKTPWYAPLAFGGTLRLRTSRGFHVDASAVEGSGDGSEGPQLAPLYSSGGLMGPASSAPQEEGLWNVGCCDAQTAMTIDLKVDKSVKDRVFVDGMGDVAIKHSLQTCFAYTTIEQDEDGSYYTVRRIQIASLNLPLAHDTESLYATLDPEALAVVLFHKLTIASLQDGLIATHEIGLEWLVSLLTCVYRSALQEEALQQEQLSRGLDNMNPVFYAQERLLNRDGGELGQQDVLLAQGHERLMSIPLVVFALLQCDALRPCMGSFHPTLDARCAASAQMYSMLPSTLARCIAPRLELWASGNDDEDPIEEDLDLSLEHVGMGVMEHRQTGNGGGELVLFVDTPREVLVCDSRHLQNSDNVSNLVIGKGLERCIELARDCYRLSPPVVRDLDLADSSLALARLKDVLVEDSSTIQGLENYEQWKQEVAGMVQEGLE